MAFFVAMACSISASQGLLALLLVLVLASPALVRQPAAGPDGAAEPVVARGPTSPRFAAIP